MAKAIITMKVMPISPDVDMDKLFTDVNEKIQGFTGGSDIKHVIEPLAFGLKSLKVTFVSDEDLGSTDAVEEDIAKITDVNSVEVTDVRRAIG